MIQNSFMIQSSVPQHLLRKFLFRGCLLGFLGISFLVMSAIFLDEFILSFFGWLIYILSFVLIIKGLIPHRHLVFLQNNPNELHITTEGMVEFYRKKQCLIQFPLKEVLSLQFRKNFKNIPEIAIKVKSFSFEKGLSQTDSTFKVQDKELIFRYFSLHAYRELKAISEELD